MADAGGAVYLLSSYQSSEQRWRRREGGKGAGSDTPGRMKGLTKGNTLFQRKYQLLPPTAPLAGMLCERLKTSEVEDR